MIFHKKFLTAYFIFQVYSLEIALKILLEESSYWNQFVIVVQLLRQVFQLFSNIKNFFGHQIEDFFLLSNVNVSLDFVFIYFLPKQKMESKLIILYLEIIFIRIRSILIKHVNLKYSQTKLLRKFIAIEIIQTLCDLIIAEIIIKYFFGVIHYESLPNIFVLFLMINTPQESDIKLIENNYTFFKIAFHLLFLNMFFELEAIQYKLFTVYFILKVIQASYVQRKEIKHVLNFKSYSSYLKELNSILEQENQKLNIFKIDFIVYNFQDNPNQGIYQEQVRALKNLSYAQYHYKSFGFMINLVNKSLLQDIDKVIGIMSKNTIMQYLAESEFLLQQDNQPWIYNYNFDDNELLQIAIYRSLNQPFGQPFTYKKKKLINNNYLLMILAFQKNIQEYITFSPEQTLYDLYSL